MRILIVNAHPSSADGQKAFNRFLESVKEALNSCADYLDKEDGCIIRAKDNLEEFLFGDRGSYNSFASAKRFDSIDVVLISGGVPLLPWSQSASQMLVLMKMCMKVKKYLFACGTGMDALVYLSASNLESPINVINGKGKGSKISDINKITSPTASIKTGYDLFLDGCTGDLYSLKAELREWIPFCNIGLHNHKMAQEYNTLGKYVIQSPVYRPTKLATNQAQANCFYERYEVMCYIRKVYSNHWLFTDCGLEFIVPHKSRWHVHSFAFTNASKAFEVIADSEDGPLIIDYKKIIGVKFEVDKKYSETYLMLRNFLNRCTKDMSSIAGRTRSIIREETIDFERTNNILFNPSDLENSLTKAESEKSHALKKNNFYIRHMKHNSSELPTEEASELKHSGYAITKRGQQIQKHNFITQFNGPLELKAPSPTNAKSAVRRKKAVTILTNDTTLKTPSVSNPMTTGYTMMSPSFDPKMNNTSFNTMISKSSRSKEVELKSILTRGSRDPHSVQDGIKNMMNVFDVIKQGGSYTIDEPQLTREDARKILYPELAEFKNSFEKRSWVPGSMSQHRRQQSEEKLRKAISKYEEMEAKMKSARLKTPKDPIGVSSYKSIRASCPYLTFHDIKKEDEKKGKEYIIGNKVFITSTKNTPRGLELKSAQRSSDRPSTKGSFYGKLRID